ncbi:MAG: hypothetical protein WAW10_02675 [Gallionella sp.]
MATIEQRLKALEQQQGNAPMQVLFVGDRPTPEQQTEIDKAIMAGRMMVVFVAHGDTAWIADADNPPPWAHHG